MIRRQDGFTLVELMITMAIFVLVIAAASNIFTGILGQFKQQSKIAETSIAGIVGFEMLKYDLEQAGYGLPWVMNGATYAAEALDDAATPFNETGFNDAPDGVPMAIRIGDNANVPSAGMNPSDVLVIKSTNIAVNDASQKWTHISNTGALPNTLRGWGAIASENLDPTDYAIVMNPFTATNQRILMNNAGAFSVHLQDLPSGGGGASAFEPVADSYNTFVAYGIKPADNPDVPPRMPFNRADFYLKVPATIPPRCARSVPGFGGTAILYKATVNHADGSHTELPILDCVADMQVIFMIDHDDNPATGNAVTNTLAGFTAVQIRNRVKEMRVYIISHDGQVDTTYTSPASMEIRDPDFGLVSTFTIPDVPGTNNPRNYRWKLYSLSINPYNLR